MAKVRLPNLIKGVRPKKIEKEKQNIFVIILFVLINAFAIILFYNNNTVAFAITLILGILFIFNFRSNVLIGVFIVGMLAAFLEMLAASYGVGNYANPNFGNVPVWLFVIWGNVSMSIYRIAVELERVGFHK